MSISVHQIKNTLQVFTYEVLSEIRHFRMLEMSFVNSLLT